MTTHNDSQACCLHVHLDGITPPIWRRLLVPPAMSLFELHLVLQAAFDWDDCHLHDFRQGKGKARRLLALPELRDVDFHHHDTDLPKEEEVTVAEVLARKGSSITYVYDYGDHWEHIVRLESRPRDDGPLPRCLDGERAAPPEDCGGNTGYHACLSALDDPHAAPETVDWLGEWAPEHIDIGTINEDIADRLSEANSTRLPVAADLLEALRSPDDLGVPESSVARFLEASGSLIQAFPEEAGVAGYLEAPEAGIPKGVLDLTDEYLFDGPWTLMLHENEEDFLGTAPGDAPQAKRLLTVAFLPAFSLPPSSRDLLPTGVNDIVAVPAVLLPEGLTPPNHEEIDLLSTCIEVLTHSLGQWDTDEPLPPGVEGAWDLAGRTVEIRFSPDPALCRHDSYLASENEGLRLGFEKEEDLDDAGEA